jgi:proliferating cell nuclear antigen
MNILIQNPAKIEVFAIIFQNLKSISDQVNVQFDQEKMYIQTMDSARISILEISLPSTWFCTYKCDNANQQSTTEESTAKYTLGINTQIMYKILSTRDKNQTINLQYNHDEDIMHINMRAIDEAGAPIPGAGFDKQFELPLIDLDTEWLGIPEIDYQVEIALHSAVFSTLIHQLRGFGDSLEIHCDEDTIRFTAKTQDSGSMAVNVRMDDLTEFAIEEECNLDLNFGLQYLQNICNYGKITKQVQIKLHADYPLRIDYPLENDGFVKYFLAPKMNDGYDS